MGEAQRKLDEAAREFEAWVREQVYGPQPQSEDDDAKQQPPSSGREGEERGVNTFQVRPVDKSTAERFVLTKHYSRRASIFWAGFALVIDNLIEGVCVYGQPSPPIQRHAFKDRDFRLYELSRLVIQTTRKNAASFLVGHSLQMLDSPCAVVSYADTEYGHAGIVYQATNWLYTGATTSHDKAYLVEGKRVHPITLRDQYGVTDPMRWSRENNIAIVRPRPKHRYFFLVGSRRQVRLMRSKLRYPVLSGYPKLPKSVYDDGPRIELTYPRTGDIEPSTKET